MFTQMCEAVASCHAQQVFHRDIKPENFIVTDGWFTAPNGSQERKVIVKLTDFGLSTTDLESVDMDCGSAPYMSYGALIFFSHFFPPSLTLTSFCYRMQK
jgi:serine/threonine protein kinase